MNKQTQRIFRQMVILINQYKGEKIAFSYLVNSLDGSLNAIEEHLPSSFYENWAEHWIHLDTILALGTEKTEQELLSNELDALEDLIQRLISLAVSFPRI